MKYHPGNYTAVLNGFNLGEIKYIDEPAIIGVNKRYLWRKLEPEKDRYDFSSIDNDLQFCKEKGKQLVVFLIDRSFWKRGAMPGYLSSLERKADGGGFTNPRWYADVSE